MRTALFLLLLLALASIPGSLLPQRSSDPNGVVQYIDRNPGIAPLLEAVQAFDSYGSFWYSSIYILLFISLIGCVVPRAKHHWDALRAQPPRTPARLSRLPVHQIDTYRQPVDNEAVLLKAERILKAARYRVTRYTTGTTTSLSAERGYLRETGNLVFHLSLVGLLVAVAIGGLFGYAGQRVVVEGEGFANVQSSYDTFNPGRLFTPEVLSPYRITLDNFDVVYEESDQGALGQPLDYTASVSITEPGNDSVRSDVIKVNRPLELAGADIFLLGNGYAPRITIRNPAGDAVFSGAVPFLPQDSNLTSLGVIKVPDGLSEQIGMLSFFYPTEETAASGAKFSSYPDLIYPTMTLNVFQGDLGLDGGVPTSVYSLDTSTLTQLTGGDTGTDSLQLRPGDTAQLPNGLGSITLDEISRFASFDLSYDPAQDVVLVFSILATAGLLTSLFVARRRLWVKVAPQRDGSVAIEYAGLARGDDPRLKDAVAAFRDKHRASLTLPGDDGESAS
ncbi:cytochrome c biogenesis protein ResB [Herbiconiux sp. YIM B11900]|uniref:cytochrome c biogenesis protein ResB n=1 Tax=Herbiconiux sp. YIM B11900 TaxID=3404131 RepID=UPI003F8301F5